MEKIVNKQPYIMDLFAGCGGLSLGFELAGFQPIFVNELNDDARETYLANRTHVIGGGKFSEHKELVSSDIKEMNEQRIDQLKGRLTELLGSNISFGKESEVDVIAGGPPCQGFSGIGHRRSYAVDKINLPSNQLYNWMAFFIEQVMPKVFVFENVKGLLSARWTDEGNKGEIWRDVYGRFQELGAEKGYKVKWQLVTAKDYGVPQNRPRVIIIGVRNDVAESAKDFIDLNSTSDSAYDTNFLPRFGARKVPNLVELLSDLEDPLVPFALRNQDFAKPFATNTYPSPAANKIQKWFRGSTGFTTGAEVTEQEYSRHALKIVTKFDAMLRNGGDIPSEFRTKKFAQRVLPAQWGNKGPFITATSMPDDYVHYSQPRILTVREWARLQTFPDHYLFSGKRTTGGLRRAGNPRQGLHDREVPKYTQIGNAVPVFLAEAIGLHIQKILRA